MLDQGTQRRAQADGHVVHRAAQSQRPALPVLGDQLHRPDPDRGQHHAHADAQQHAQADEFGDRPGERVADRGERGQQRSADGQGPGAEPVHHHPRHRAGQQRRHRVAADDRADLGRAAVQSAGDVPGQDRDGQGERQIADPVRQRDQQRVPDGPLVGGLDLGF